MIYEPENLKNKRTMYEKKAKMLVTIEFFLWAVILFVYVNIVIPYVGSTIGFLTIIIGGIANDEITWYLNIATAFSVLGKKNESISLLKQLEEVTTGGDKELIQKSIEFIQGQMENEC